MVRHARDDHGARHWGDHGACHRGAWGARGARAGRTWNQRARRGPLDWLVKPPMSQATYGAPASPQLRTRPAVLT
eukprot:1081636-Prymnesium_polylepis.1